MARWLHLFAEWLRCWAETIEHTTVALASLIGGAWVLFRFINERALESALTIGVEASTISFDGTPLTFVDVTLTNVGKVRLQAKPVNQETTAYKDEKGVEIVQYSCDLGIKKLLSGVYQTGDLIDWFKKEGFGPPLEFTLLNEYEDPDKDNRVDFWMEPAEEYHLGMPLRLDTGIYLVKVTFIGARSDKEFWSRIVMVQV